MPYFIFFLTAFILSFAVTFLVRKLALRLGIVDLPPHQLAKNSTGSDGATSKTEVTQSSEKGMSNWWGGMPELSGRKIHPNPIPLLGGLAIFISFIFVLGALAYFYPAKLFGDFITPSKLFWIFLGGLFLVIGGYLDDKYGLKPRYQFVWAALAALAISLAGIGISHIRNPFPLEIPFLTGQVGGVIRFDLLKLGFLTFPQDLFTFVWLLGMMYTTKLLDGLDGLVSGIISIGSLIIFFVALQPFVRQYDTAYLAIGLAGVFLGFLIWNFHPAKIFLGESGSLLAGYFLGILAIISGSKVATTLLIMGVPILDVAWVILRRLFFEKKSFAEADSKHLHFRLLGAGFSHRGAVLFLYAITAVFGLTTLFFQTQQKFIVLILVVLVMIGLGGWLVKPKIKNQKLKTKT